MLRQAFRALRQHRLRSLLSALGVVFGVLAVVTMLAIAEGARRETLEAIRDLGTNTVIVRRVEAAGGRPAEAGRPPPPGLVEGDVAALRRGLPGTARVACCREMKGRVHAPESGEPLRAFAISAGYLELRGLVVEKGRPLGDADEQARSRVAAVGAEAGRRIGGCGAVARVQDATYPVVGVLARRGERRSRGPALPTLDADRGVFVPLGADPGEPYTGVGRWDAVNEILVRFDDVSDVRPWAAVVDRILSADRGEARGYDLVLPQELLREAQRAQRTFRLVLGGLAAVSLLVGGIGIMNIMLANVTERTREIGIRRAVGASREHIAAQFLYEAVLLTAAGAVIGVALGAAAAAVVSRVAGWPTAVTPWSVGLALLMAGGVGLLSGLYPALRAARLDPILALRHE
jgi:putative ABC transport system permease protein